MDLLGGHERETLPEIETHLMSEQRQRARSGPIVLGDAGLADQAQQVEVRLHCAVTRFPEGSRRR